MGRERDLERVWRGHTGDQGSACTTGTGDRFHSMSIHSEVTPASHSACYVLQEGVSLNNSVIDVYAVNTILCTIQRKTANAARTVDADVLHDASS